VAEGGALRAGIIEECKIRRFNNGRMEYSDNRIIEMIVEYANSTFEFDTTGEVRKFSCA
jgi:hypothetical protein